MAFSKMKGRIKKSPGCFCRGDIVDQRYLFKIEFAYNG